MLFVVVLLAIAFLSVVAIILLRRAGGGKFPWLQFYLKGREQGFVFREINLLRRVAVEAKLDNPTALFWSIKQLDRSLKGTIIRYRARSREQDPEYNLLLAQEYVQLLLSDPRIKNNLILFAVAYNHGPTAMSRWQQAQSEDQSDPLLFLESVPWQQARVYTLRVLANYWIYRLRLNQPTPDLDALAAGHWPTYIAFDGKFVADAGRHAKN